MYRQCQKEAETIKESDSNNEHAQLACHCTLYTAWRFILQSKGAPPSIIHPSTIVNVMS